MTAGHDGANTPPADDDPFAHLYRPEGGAAAAPGAGQVDGAAPPMPTAGVPRTSYTQVRPVGERTFGGGMPQQGYGYPNGNAHYAAPETYGGPPQGPPPGYDDYDDRPRRGGHGGGRNGVVLGAIAIVVTVAVAIGAAMYFGGDDDKGDDKAGGQSPSAQESKGGGGKPKTPGALPKADAEKLQLAGSAALAGDVKGAPSKSGQYVAGINQAGSSAGWTVQVPKAGQYYFYADYGVPGKDQELALSVNGEAQTRPMNMENFAGGPEGDWEKGWTYTYSMVQLKKGSNELKLSCEDASKCEVNIAAYEIRKNKRP
ncbi:hypothetical protein [Streptomyces boninensis]|uniref:hypothetical protein n=1 Tax=Streptomyces boninensis TaxID=2039455 RepID=UPI003B21CA23